METTFEITYPVPPLLLIGGESRTREESWRKASLYCPLCGKADVWFRIRSQGKSPSYICAACAISFYLPNFHRLRGIPDLQRLKHLREVK